MIVLPHFFRLLGYLFVVSFMFSVGARTPNLGRILEHRHKKSIFKILFANVVLIPLAGLLLLHFFHLPHELRLGFLLVALTPGGLFGLHFAHLSRGDMVYALSLTLILSLVAILVVPFNASLILPTTISSKILDIKILIELALFALLPLLLGQWLQKHFPHFANKFGNIISYFSMVMFAAQEIVGTKLKDMSLDLVKHPLIWAFVLLIVISWIVGWFFAENDVQKKKVLAIDTAMRNIPICWLIVNKSFADTNVDYALIAFTAVVTPMNFVFGLCTRFLFKNREKD